MPFKVSWIFLVINQPTLSFRMAMAIANMVNPLIHEIMAHKVVPSDCVNPATRNVRNAISATVSA